jgi:hypothetical protein
MGRVSGMEISSLPKISPREEQSLPPNFKVKFPYLKPTAHLEIVYQVMKGIEISQWPSCIDSYRNKHFSMFFYAQVLFSTKGREYQFCNGPR